MDMVEPAKERQEVDVSRPARRKGGSKVVQRALTSSPDVEKKPLEISKPPTAELPQVTNVTGLSGEVKKIERKITVRAVEKGVGTVKGELKKKSPELENLKKKIFGGK